ncbi:hypothetical protein [Arthrobacter sp.]|uniref:hypothetical protein n=1 Tax=Arthrobacter sp. TaxID=1667 RepID=UPI003395CF54
MFVDPDDLLACVERDTTGVNCQEDFHIPVLPQSDIALTSGLAWPPALSEAGQPGVFKRFSGCPPAGKGQPTVVPS